MRGRRSSGILSHRAPARAIDNSLLIDLQVRKIISQQIDAACLGELVGGGNQFKIGEFIEGTIEEEDKMAREVSTMSGWRSSGSPEDRIAKVWLNEQKGVLCARFPFDRETIDDFKLKIPKGKKTWDSDQKIWEFSVETIDVVVEILEEHFPGKVVDLTQAVAPPLPQRNGDAFLSLLDEEDIKQVRRVLSLRHHPDKGGDGEKLAKINEKLDGRMR